MKRHVIVDANNLFHRYYWTSQEDGEHPLYGIASWLLNEIKSPTTRSVTFAWDSPINHKKHKYPSYKANRPELPQDFYPKLRQTTSFLASAGVQQLEVEGYEADDLVYTLALKLGSVEIVSSDKDMLLMVMPGFGCVVRLIKREYDNKTGETHTVEKMIDTAEKVEAETGGIGPDRIWHYKALMGDSSDNVKGVEGIGPKYAKELILNYNNLYNISASLSMVERDWSGERGPYKRFYNLEAAFNDSSVFKSLELIEPVQVDSLEMVEPYLPDERRILNAVKKYKRVLS